MYNINSTQKTHLKFKDRACEIRKNKSTTLVKAIKQTCLQKILDCESRDFNEELQ